MSGFLTFNIDDGYLEGIVRGYRAKILTANDYANLTQCDVLDDVKLHLASTDYGTFLQNEPSPLVTSTLMKKCTEKMVKEFRFIQSQAVGPMTKFLDYIT